MPEPSWPRLRRAGLVGVQMDDNVRGRILSGRRQTGLPAVLLLKLCLTRHCGKVRWR